MSTVVWPPLPAAQLPASEEATRTRELEWLLASLQDSLKSLKSGLEECALLLSPSEPGSTLALSSHRTEHLKGFLTRVGTRVVKADVTLRLSSLPPPRGQPSLRLVLSSSPSSPSLVLEQLTTARTLINACLDVVDATRWTGDSRNPDFISSQLRLLHDDMREARAALQGWTARQRGWNDDPLPDLAFEPPLPPNLALHLSVSEAALLLNVRVLEPVYPSTGTNSPFSLTPGGGNGAAGGGGGGGSYSGFSLRERLATALGAGGAGRQAAFHDEAHEVFVYRGQEVRVREKVRVESQDPSLMAAFAKLGALERTLALSRRGLAVVMGREMEGEDEEEG